MPTSVLAVLVTTVRPSLTEVTVGKLSVDEASLKVTVHPRLLCHG